MKFTWKEQLLRGYFLVLGTTGLLISAPAYFHEGKMWMGTASVLNSLALFGVFWFLGFFHKVKDQLAKWSDQKSVEACPDDEDEEDDEDDADHWKKES